MWPLFRQQSWAITLAAGALMTPSCESRATAGQGPICQDVNIPVTVSAMNKQLPTDLVLSNPTSLLNAVASELLVLPVSGTFNIAGRYCKPEVTIPGREKTLQLLVHGITYDRNYWSGLGFPGYQGNNYSWVAYASRQGYHTLSIDRLGNGVSDHPDPITVVQLPVHVETLHGVITAARSGSIANTNFDKIIYVGHSYGSLIANALSEKYPNDADSLVLTGFSKQLLVACPGVLLTGLFLPADILLPSRFGNLDPGYTAGSSKSGREALFYSVPGRDFDPQIFEVDYQTQGTLSLGETITALISVDEAPNYTGNVFVMTGQQDIIFCGLGTPLLGPGNCGQGESSLPAQTRSLYPNVSVYGFHIPSNTGHDINNHYSAQKSFEAAHDWLASIGL
jgi:pimeloyl-ACP methyl ester carboxylesterase